MYSNARTRSMSIFVRYKILFIWLHHGALLARVPGVVVVVVKEDPDLEKEGKKGKNKTSFLRIQATM